MGVEPKIGGFPPKSSHLFGMRVFHEINHPFLGGKIPLYLGTPIYVRTNNVSKKITVESLDSTL